MSHAEVDRLFRHEAGRLTATLVRLLGPGQLDLAQDLVQETLVVALEQWKFGLPANPAAWLTSVARNRALDAIRRRSAMTRAEPEIVAQWQRHAETSHVEAHFAKEVGDDVLKMMFSCCTPRLTPAAQVALMLKTLGGFSVNEIAAAFLANPDAIERRLSRAKAAFREHELFDVEHASDLQTRLSSVQRAIYLLFNEGYHGAHPEAVVRDELCSEALRLGDWLCRNTLTATPSTHALMALMCFSAARVSARRDALGVLRSLDAQDRSQWSAELLRRGFEHLSQSAAGAALTPFHLQAGIAAIHAAAPSWAETDWARIVDAYEVLLTLEDSAVVRLNRSVAIARLLGAEAGLTALDDVDAEALETYPFFAAARADFEWERGRHDVARRHYREALELARNEPERQFLEARLARAPA